MIPKVLSETYGYTVGSTIVSLPTIPTETIRAIIQVEIEAVRARFDSTNTVTIGTAGGILFPVNTVANPFYVIEGYDKLSAMRLHGNSTSDSVINVIYYGEGGLVA